MKSKACPHPGAHRIGDHEKAVHTAIRKIGDSRDVSIPQPVPAPGSHDHRRQPSGTVPRSRRLPRHEGLDPARTEAPARQVRLVERMGKLDAATLSAFPNALFDSFEG